MLLVARMLLVVMPFVTSSNALVPSSFLFLVEMPGATSSVLAPSSNALVPSSFLSPWPKDSRSNIRRLHTIEPYLSTTKHE